MKSGELQRRAEALAEANRRKDEFLAILSHELRNPLAPIQSSVEILARRVQDTFARRAVEVIERQSKHLKRLVDDLLDVARITRGKIELRKERVELRGLIAHVVMAVRPFIEERQQPLTISLADRDVWINADPTRLSQALASEATTDTMMVVNAPSDQTARIESEATVRRSQNVTLARTPAAGISCDKRGLIICLHYQTQPVHR